MTQKNVLRELGCLRRVLENGRVKVGSDCGIISKENLAQLLNELGSISVSTLRSSEGGDPDRRHGFDAIQHLDAPEFLKDCIHELETSAEEQDIAAIFRVVNVSLLQSRVNEIHQVSNQGRPVRSKAALSVLRSRSTDQFVG
jgi:hypothetical protein